jgi:hypothetical protein
MHSTSPEKARSTFQNAVRRAVLLASAVLLALLVGQRPAAAQPVAPDAPGALAAVAEPLAQALAEQTGPVSFLAILDAQTLPADLLFAADASLVARRTAIYQQMTATAQQSQSALRGWLDAQGIAYTPFWLVNMVEIKGDRALVEALRRRPEINRLVLNPSIASAQLAHDETRRGMGRRDVVAALVGKSRRACRARRVALWPDHDRR